MQTILRILKQAGGWHHGLYLKIENPPYMALVIEATDEIRGRAVSPLSLSRTTAKQKQRPDCRDPEMCFRVLDFAGRSAP